MAIDQQVIQVNRYQLVDTPEAFTEAIQALARRTEREGHPGVLKYQFYVNSDEGTAGASIVYENADAWVGHHRLAYEWEEMPVLQATVKLQGLLLFGPLNDELEGWLTGGDLDLIHYDSLAAGFERP